MTTLPVAAAIEEEPELNVDSWPDYIAPGVIAQFERETGIKVNYQTDESDEALETKLLIGHTGLDVVLPSAPFFQRQMNAGVYQKLDRAALPNYANLDRQVLAYMSAYDPNNQFAVPYLRTTVGLYYDADKIRARLGDVTPDSWSLIFNPTIAAKLKDCGIGFAAVPTQVFGAVLQYDGIDPRRLTQAQVGRALQTLELIRPYLSGHPHAFALHDADLVSGNFCVALTWGGDAVLARARAAKSIHPAHLEFIIPREGGQRWLDMMAIPADAPHPRNALRWMNFLMRPEVIARISESVRYANGNAASFRLLSAELKNDPIIYPDAATQKRLINAISSTAQISLLVNHAWRDLKAGR